MLIIGYVKRLVVALNGDVNQFNKCLFIGAVSKQIYVSHSFKNVYDPKYMEEVRDKADGCTTGQPLDQPYVDRTPREAKVLAYSSDSAQSGCGA